MKYIIANWKAYVTDSKEVKNLFSILEKSVSDINIVKFIICPPNIFLKDVKSKNNLSIGIQNVFWEEKGAYTGETTIGMLKNLEVEYVILGHSERREYFKESDEDINKKVKAVLKAGFKVILCVGEKEREVDGSIPVIVAEQIQKDLNGVSKNKLKDVIIAYEPIWAIGSGESDTPENAYRAALYIKKIIGDIYGEKSGVDMNVLYGGSVNSKNIYDFINHYGLDGVLIGSASAKKDELKKIVKIIKD